MFTLSSQYIFGIALLLAFGAGLVALRRRSSMFNLNLILFENWLPFLLVISLTCARLAALGTLDLLDIMQTQWWRILYFWDGNLNLWGAIFGFTATLAWFCKKTGQSFGRWADALARPFFLMLFVGRLGNFGDGGVYYGQPTDNFLGITIDNIFFPLSGIKHWPIALYEALFALVIYALRPLWRRQIMPGAQFCLALGIYAVWRAGIEFLRFDAVEMLEHVTWDQILAGVTLLGSISAFLIQNVRYHKLQKQNGAHR